MNNVINFCLELVLVVKEIDEVIVVYVIEKNCCYGVFRSYLCECEIISMSLEWMC